MATDTDKLVSEIRALPAEEKIRVLDAILTDLDKPDDEIDQIWAVEAQNGGTPTRQGGLVLCLMKS